MFELYIVGNDIDWFFDGHMTADEMRSKREFSQLFSEPCALYGDGDGRVFGFETVERAAARLAIPTSSGPAGTVDLMNALLMGTYKAPGVAEVEEKADAAQTAAQTASETAATARAAADEAKGAVADATSAAQTAAEAAATAQTTADEAKSTADEAKATAGTAAASVNQYMDALLGLDTTNETEATDAE